MIYFDKDKQNILKSLTEINIKIIFENRSVNIYINNLLFSKYELNYNITNITNAKIFLLTTENNLKDMNKSTNILEKLPKNIHKKNNVLL